MYKELAFLHFSDLHIGDSYANTILSRVKDGLIEDIQFINKELGHIDVVFMTGDLVQRGSSEEYARFDEFIHEINNLLKYQGKSPYYFFVPGNHDLERCNEAGMKRSAHRSMKQWLGDKEMRESLFWEGDSDYIKYCNERFSNYSHYVQNSSLVPHDHIKNGILPGDFYASMEINGIKMGVIGLNSSFLQIEGGNYRNKIGIYEKQIYGLFADKYVDTIKNNDINLLLTHHSPDWYEIDSSRQEYDNGIYMPKYILEHYCGHNHYPQSETTSHNNWGEKRVNIAPSLCGLEKTNEGIDRIHGYQAGKYIIDNGDIKKCFYPRIANKKAPEIYLVADSDYKLEKGEDYLMQNLRGSELSVIQDSPIVQDDILDSKPQKKTGEFLHPSTIKDSGPYTNVRYSLQERACKLFDDRILWICTKHGLGEEQFLSSVLKRMNLHEDNIIGVDCEDVTTYDGLDKLMRELFSMPLTKIVIELAMAYDCPILLLKNLNDSFVKNEQAALSNALRSVLKYNNAIRFVILSRTPPEPNYFPCIILEPLTQQEIKRVIENVGTREQYTVFDIEKIYNLTNGYPLCLDYITKELEYCDISDLNEDADLYDTSQSIPLTTRKFIESLRNSSDPTERSCYRLLLLFSVMPKGGLFQSVKWMNNGACFGWEEMKVLMEHDLITLDHYYVIKNHQIDSQSKVSRVPKIYRDFVIGLEDRNSLKDMYSDLCKLYLGGEWLNARIKLRIPKGKEDSAFYYYYNVTAALKFLLQYSIDNNDEIWFERYLNIAIIFLIIISELDLFHVALSIANDLYDIVKNVEYKSGLRHISKLKLELADLRRMNKQYHDAIPLFTEVLQEKILQKNDLQTCRQCLAYAYHRTDENEKAIEVANEMIQVEHSKKSEYYYIAKHIIIENTPDNQNKVKDLLSLYSIIKRKKIKGHLCADIAVDISFWEKSEASLKRINTELLHCDSTYTRMRLINRKYSLYSQNKLNIQLTEKDIDAVRSVYTFAFLGMVVPLLNESHKILWDYYMEKKEYPMVVNILVHSCVIWEMNNQIEYIEKYIEFIQNDKGFVNWAKSNIQDENVLILIRDRSLTFTN